MTKNSSPSETYQKIREAKDFIESKSTYKPKVGIVLGSGLGALAEIVKNPISISYSEIPHFLPPTVEGHQGKMLLGEINNVPVVILQGRLHYYEGHDMEDVVFPTRTICALGIQTIILTNAAGGINTRFRACDLMLIEDHINLMGQNPLKGPNLSELGQRFPDMTEAYNKQCFEVFKKTATDIGIPLHTGVYAGVMGPTYETPAEIKMLRIIGGDAVGMSTVPESIAANHLGVQVVGISAITNLAAGISPNKLNHDEVMVHSKSMSENLSKLISEALPSIILKGTLK